MISMMPISRSCLLAAALVFAFACVESRAQPAETNTVDAMDSLLDFAAQPSDPEEAQSDKLQKLLAESSSLRDPFWPVGYQPPKPKKKEDPKPVQTQATDPAPRVDATPRWDEALKTVSIKGIMSVGGGKYMAVINDQVVSESDTVSANYMGRSYSWKVTSINAQGVKFQKMDSGAR